jgi:hypothetical protein
MAKTPSDKLYRLVHALSPAEKRYFRIFIRGKTERNSLYLRLFDILSTLESFDEDWVKTKLYKSQPPEGKKYSELKSYLYDLIVKSLQAYDENQSVVYRLNQLLQGVSVLFKRGLYQDCHDLLHKATRLAKQYEHYTQLLHIIQWEKHLAYTKMDVDFLHKNLAQLIYEEENALAQIKNTADYRKAFFRVYATIKREAQHRGDNRILQLQQIVNQEVFAHSDMAKSHQARVMYYRTLNLYHYAMSDNQAFYESVVTLINLIESQPHFLRENLADYIAALSNLILSCGLLRKYDEVKLNLAKLRALTPLTEDDRRKIHRQYYSNMFVLCIFSGDFYLGKKEMEHCQNEMPQSSADDYETASFFFQYCVICFGNDDYDGALHHLNVWLNQPRSVEREDLQSLARILLLIIHYEMNNTVLLESLLRSATRFLQKKNRLYDLERRLIHFISELIQTADNRDKKLIFNKMKGELILHAKNPGVRSLLQTFDLDAWLTSKINGQRFADVVREKWNAEQ